MLKKCLIGASAFAGLVLFAVAVVGISMQACAPNQLHQEDVQPKDTTVTVDVPENTPCDNAGVETIFLCKDDDENLSWSNPIFNELCVTTWTPQSGNMTVVCDFLLCEDDFEWVGISNPCPIPDEYTWEVTGASTPSGGSQWTGTLTFEPDECIAEWFPACYEFTIKSFAERTLTEFSVAHCMDDSEFDMWYGLWEECFNNGCRTSWNPTQGRMCIECIWPILEEGFEWTSNDHCEVPEYTWEVSTNYDPDEGMYWEGKLLFPPNECLAEEVDNCHHFVILGYNCPY